MPRSTGGRIAHPDRRLAARALAEWGAGAVLGAHLGSSASSVYAADADGRRRVLRLTDARFRTRRATEAEIHFTEFLGECGVPVSRSVRTHDGRWTVPVRAGERTFIAMLSSWAPGVVVDETSPRLDSRFAHEWGASLAELHCASARYEAADPEGRSPWTDEVWLANAPGLIADDAPAWAEYQRVVACLAALAKTPHSYGLLHNDHGPQNFRYDLARGITHFDFGNACYGWYAMDAMPPLGYLRRIEGGRCGPLAGAFLAGYRSVRPILDDVWAVRGELLQFRRLYVYLSRLWAFGPEPAREQRTMLRALRTAALARV